MQALEIGDGLGFRPSLHYVKPPNPQSVHFYLSGLQGFFGPRREEMGSLADDGLCLYIGAWELLGQAHCGMVGLWGF